MAIQRKPNLSINFSIIIMFTSFLSKHANHRNICYALQSPLQRFNAGRSQYHVTKQSRGGFSSTYFFQLPHAPTTTTHFNLFRPRKDLIADPSSQRIKSTSLFSSTTTSNENQFYADEATYPSFSSIGIKSQILLDRIEEKLHLSRPSAVQAAAYAPILSGKDVIVGAETGSGKTLAYLMPLVDDVLQKKQQAMSNDNEFVSDYDYCRAVILVPNKELANQVLRMAIDLCGDRRETCVVWDGTNRSPLAEDDSVIRGADPNVVRLAILPGGLEEPGSFKPFRDSIGLEGSNAPVDLLICTPAALGAFGASPKNIDLFADVQTLIIDEADMLLDGGYLRQLENVLMGFRRADKLNRASFASQEEDDDEGDFFTARKTQHVFIGATLPDFGLKSVDAYIAKKFPHAQRVNMPGLHNARHYGLRDHTIWLEQPAENNNRERLEQLVDFLKSEEEYGLSEEKIMVFLNTVEDVDGVTNGLRRAGFKAVPYHAKIPLEERASNLEDFRQYTAGSSSDFTEIPILVCTDLAARGLDVPGVTAVVQLQFAGNVVAHLHRMGRCGRAGNKDGRGIIFYGPMEKDLVEVVMEAESQQEKMKLKGDVLDEEEKKKGTVKNAFSRKRGFTKKRKKERRDF